MLIDGWYDIRKEIGNQKTGTLVLCLGNSLMVVLLFTLLLGIRICSVNSKKQ